MKYRFIILLSLTVLVLSCLKKSPEKPELDNFFDPNYETGIWFEPSSIDSFLFGGGLYYYNLHFTYTSEALKEVNSLDYRIMVKRIWKDEFTSVIEYSNEGFSLVAYPADKSYGKHTFDFGVRAENSSDIVRIYKYVSAW